MDQEVAKTLGELELKLQELERELSSIGHHDKPAAAPDGPHGSVAATHEPPEPADKPTEAAPQAPGKLIDEAVESAGDGGSAEREPTGEQVAEEGDGFGGPPVFGGEENPAQAGATIEREWTVEASETAYGEIPTPPSPPSAPGGPPAPPSPPSWRHVGSPPGVPAPSLQAPPFRPSPPPSPPGEPPAPPSPPSWRHVGSPHPRPDPRRPAAAEENQSVDLAELVRFRDKLQRTMEELMDEYSKLLHVDRGPEPDA